MEKEGGRRRRRREEAKGEPFPYSEMLTLESDCSQTGRPSKSQFHINN